MARSIQQIKQDLEVLESTIVESGSELRDLYKSYLDLLSQSVKQQLILASYQICTQLYPESFLGLSLDQKQKLQQQLRVLSKEIQPELLNSQEQTELILERKDLNFVAEMIKNLPLRQKRAAKKAGKGEEEEAMPDSSSPEGEAQTPKMNLSDTPFVSAVADREGEEAKIDLEIIRTELEGLEIPELAAVIENEAAANFAEPQKQEIDFNNPEHLVLWHKQVERTIKRILDRASREVNKLLQESGVIPRRLPSKIMEVAIKAEETSSRNNRKIQSIPNILNIVIETDKDKKSKSANISQISLLRLRLSEIEFADPLLSSKRGQIRIMVNKIKQLKYQYRDKKQEYAVAEAQAAWRSSWYED